MGNVWRAYLLHDTSAIHAEFKQFLFYFETKRS